MANGIDPTNPKKFRYTLDIRGVDEEVLFNSPDGWIKTIIKYARSKTYGGLLRSLTLPTKFPFYGAYLLRKEVYTYGWQRANVNFLIEKLVPHNYTYNKLYLGKLDFSKFTDEDNTFTINATEKDVNVQVYAFADQQYSIPLDVTEALDIRITPLTLTETADFLLASSQDWRSNAYFIMTIVTNQQLSINPSVQSISNFFADPSPVFDKSNSRFFFIARVDTIVRITGAIDTFIDPRSDLAGRYQINIYKSDGTLVKTLLDETVTDRTFFQIHFDFTTTVITDDRLFIYFLHVGSANTNSGFQIGSSSLSLSYSTTSPSTHCQALRASYIYNYLVQAMNGQDNPTVITQSLLLQGILNQLTITCSNSILTPQLQAIYNAGDTLQLGARYLVIAAAVTYVTQSGVTHIYNIGEVFTAILGFDSFTSVDGGFVRQIQAKPQIILSFKDFFQSIYSLMGGQCGFGVENGVACLEDLTYFYRSTVTMLDLGTQIEVLSFKNEPNVDVAVNSIKVGYQDQQYDAVNGQLEVNSEQNYSVQTTIKNELNLVSPIRADPFGITAIQIIQANSVANSAASKSDNDTFFIWVKPEAEIGHTYYQPLTVAEGTMSYSGIDGTYYNWQITPKQNLLRGSRYLASIFHKMEGMQINLTSHEKNVGMVTIDMFGKRVAQGEPINISDLDNPIFIPYILSVNTALQFNAQELLDLNPFGVVSFIYRGNVYKGFINEIQIDSSINSTQTFKLSASPDTNLPKLIH